jgi:hypothetical protein
MATPIVANFRQVIAAGRRHTLPIESVHECAPSASVPRRASGDPVLRAGRAALLCGRRLFGLGKSRHEEDWFATNSDSWRPSTRRGYRGAIDLYLVPAFGPLRLEG